VAEFLEAASKHALSFSAIRDDVREQDNPISKVHADIENGARSVGSTD
jgi:hypothetical protein